MFNTDPSLAATTVAAGWLPLFGQVAGSLKGRRPAEQPNQAIAFALALASLLGEETQATETLPQGSSQASADEEEKASPDSLPLHPRKEGSKEAEEAATAVVLASGLRLVPAEPLPEVKAQSTKEPTKPTTQSRTPSLEGGFLANQLPQETTAAYKIGRSDLPAETVALVSPPQGAVEAEEAVQPLEPSVALSDDSSQEKPLAEPVIKSAEPSAVLKPTTHATEAAVERAVVPRAAKLADKPTVEFRPVGETAAPEQGRQGAVVQPKYQPIRPGTSQPLKEHTFSLGALSANTAGTARPIWPQVPVAPVTTSPVGKVAGENREVESTGVNPIPVSGEALTVQAPVGKGEEQLPLVSAPLSQDPQHPQHQQNLQRFQQPESLQVEAKVVAESVMVAVNPLEATERLAPAEVGMEPGREKIHKPNKERLVARETAPLVVTSPGPQTGTRPARFTMSSLGTGVVGSIAAFEQESERGFPVQAGRDSQESRVVATSVEPLQIRERQEKPRPFQIHPRLVTAPMKAVPPEQKQREESAFAVSLPEGSLAEAGPAPVVQHEHSFPQEGIRPSGTGNLMERATVAVGEVMTQSVPKRGGPEQVVAYALASLQTAVPDDVQAELGAAEPAAQVARPSTEKTVALTTEPQVGQGRTVAASPELPKSAITTAVATAPNPVGRGEHDPQTSEKEQTENDMVPKAAKTEPAFEPALQTTAEKMVQRTGSEQVPTGENVVRIAEDGPPEQWAELAERMRALAAKGDAPRAEMRLQLKPAALGDVQLIVTMQGNRLRASFTAATSGAKELIEAGLPHLQQRLALEGLPLEQVKVGVAVEIDVSKSGKKGVSSAPVSFSNWLGAMSIEQQVDHSSVKVPPVDSTATPHQLNSGGSQGGFAGNGNGPHSQQQSSYQGTPWHGFVPAMATRRSESFPGALVAPSYAGGVDLRA